MAWVEGPPRGQVWGNPPPLGPLDTTDPPRAGHRTHYTTPHLPPGTNDHHNLQVVAVLETPHPPCKKNIFRACH